jgi:putative hydrolase of HD superfamily
MESIAKYIFEAGMLKRVSRSGWWAEKVKHPESVADHAFRTAIIAFVVAKMEGLNDEEANRLCTAAVLHDMHETRLLDLNKITARYITVTKELEQKVESEQVKDMPKEVRDSLLKACELDEKEQRILKDADYLECAFQAKEYADIGHKGADTWIQNISKRLQTVSAKKLLAQMRKMDSNSWWKGLKRLD